MSEAAQPSLETAAAEAVREASRQGRLATCGEVVAALAEQGLDVASQEATGQVAASLAGNAAIASFPSLGGEPVYHDPAILSAAYARILDRKAFPLTLMAEEIRLNARDYRRPVPVELFESPPFDLTPDAIGQALQAMADLPAYGDITFTTTSSGAVYLFSTQGLERNYATFLAEHAEGLAMNP